MQYYYIIMKLKLKEETKYKNKKNKLFEDYKKKEDIINKLQQEYYYKEGEKYTFFPIINNYIIKYNNSCFINNKIGITGNDNNGSKNMNYSLFNNISNKTFDFNKKKENKRFGKNIIIKRKRIINNLSKKFIIISKNNDYNKTFKLNGLKNKRSTSYILKRIKTEESLCKTKKSKMSLKKLIQEENIKNKIINKKMSHNISKNDVNKLTDSIFNIDKNNKSYKNKDKIKTESSFLFSHDESNIFNDKMNDNLKLYTDSNSTYDNINFLLKRINVKNCLLNKNNIRKIENKYIFNKNNNYLNNKIISVDINKTKNLIDNKKIYNKMNYNNNNLKNEKSKIIPIFPYKKITIIKNKSKLEKINLNKILKNLKNNNSKNKYINSQYIFNYKRTQTNNEETTQTSDKEMYKNVSFEIKNKKIDKEFNNNYSYKRDEEDISIQSLSDSKVFEIANTYIDDEVDKKQISGILTHKKIQNSNS